MGKSSDLVKCLAESLGVEERDIVGEVTDETALETENGKEDGEDE